MNQKRLEILIESTIKNSNTDALTLKQLRKILTDEGLDLSSIHDSQLALIINNIPMVNDIDSNLVESTVCVNSCGGVPPGFILK